MAPCMQDQSVWVLTMPLMFIVKTPLCKSPWYILPTHLTSRHNNLTSVCDRGGQLKYRMYLLALSACFVWLLPNLSFFFGSLSCVSAKFLHVTKSSARAASYHEVNTEYPLKAPTTPLLSQLLTLSHYHSATSSRLYHHSHRPKPLFNILP
jgi:hypothetical protein